MMKTFQTIHKRIQSNWLTSDPLDPSFILNKPVLDATNLTAGVGIEIAGIFPNFTISADNDTALWNANQLQGTTISNTTPTNGQVLLYNGVSWVPTTISTGGTGSVTSVNATTTNGNAATITGGPITSIGTLNFTWQGTAGQYVTGNGTLATFPTIPSAAGFIQNQFTIAQVADYWITGYARLNTLAGSGYRMVVATSTGTLETQPLPVASVVNNGILTINGSGIATGSTTFGANQATNSTATINVPGTNIGASISGQTVTLTSSTGTGGSFVIPNDIQTLSIGAASNTHLGHVLSISGGNSVNINSPRIQTGTSWTNQPRNTQGYFYDGTGGNAIPPIQPNGITAATYMTWGSPVDYPSGILALGANPYSTDGDFLFWKKNYDDSNTTSSWYQVASRSWVIAQGYTNNTGTVSSVNVTGSGALVASGGPITTAGTIALNWSGGPSQVVLGDGTLAPLPVSDQTVIITGSGATTVTGTYPNFNISSTDTNNVYTAGTGVSIVGNVISATGAFAENGILTINTSGIATGSGTFSANQSTNNTITVSVPGTSLTSSVSGNNVTVNSSTGSSTTFTLPAGAVATNVLAGAGITVTGTQPNLTVTNTAPDQLVTLTGSGATSVSGTYPNFTINSVDTNTTYSAGTGITLTGTVFSNSAPDQIVSIVGGGATSVAGTYPNFTVSSTDTNTTYGAGTGLSLVGTTFNNTAPDQVVSITGTGTTVVTGTYPSFTINTPSIADTNFAINDLTLTGNRVHNGAGFGLRYDDIGTFNVALADEISLSVNPGSSIQLSSSIIFNSGDVVYYRLNGATAGVNLNGSNVSSSDKIHYLPNGNGTYALSVNGISADVNGDITLTIPNPVDTNFANTDLLFNANRVHNLATNNLSFNNGALFEVNMSDTILLNAGNLSVIMDNTFKVSDNGLFSTLTTVNLNSDRDHRLPDASGTLVLSVNGIFADTEGNIDLTSNPGIPTVSLNTGWIGGAFTPGSNDDYGTVTLRVEPLVIPYANPGLACTIRLSQPKDVIMVPVVTLQDDSLTNVGPAKGLTVRVLDNQNFEVYFTSEIDLPVHNDYKIHYHVMGR